MNIEKQTTNNSLSITLTGKLDTLTAPDLEAELKTINEDIKELILDFSALTYLSSAGLRVILGAQKQMTKAGGSMIVKNVSDTIMEVFEITGFKGILTIQ